MCPTLTSTLFPYTTLFRSHSPPRCRGTGGATSSRFWRTTVFRARPRASNRGYASGSSTSPTGRGTYNRSEEHTSELQSRVELVCRLLLEKKKNSVVHLSL